MSVEVREAVAAMVLEAAEKRKRKAEQQAAHDEQAKALRAELEEARDHGLQARHAAKLAHVPRQRRGGQPVLPFTAATAATESAP